MQAVLAQYYFKYVAKYRQLAIVLHKVHLQEQQVIRYQYLIR